MQNKTAAMFNQLDSLGMPAAGLKQLDFPMEVQSMFQDMFVPSNRDAPQAGLEAQPVPVQNSPIARVYGSEADM